jgi:dihydrolipoamide dehydrogenase
MELETGCILLATGSEPSPLPFMDFDGKTVVSSTEALSLTSVPEKLLVIGAGAIGLELGSVWSRLGSSVTVIEIMPSILPGWDKQVSTTLKRELTRQGLQFELETRVKDFKTGKKGITLQCEDKTGKTRSYSGDKALLAVGRRPNYGGQNLDELSIQRDKTGRIVVDRRFQTTCQGIYAVGDLIAGPMLAHKGEEEGVAFAEILANRAGHVNYDTIPNIVYTWPEAAGVGRTEEQLKEDGVAYTKGSFPFRANGRALAMGDTEGFVKILSDKFTDRILGAHIVGPWASSLIAEIVAVMEFGGSSEDIARTVHGHPTLPEAVKEAALDVDGRPIHNL